MHSLRLLFSISYIILQFATLLTSAQFCMNNLGNYTTNSTYQRNLNNLLSQFLVSNTQIDYGFYNLSVGQAPDQVNALALCKGDVSLDECRGCIRNSTREITQHCPNQKEVLGFYDSCMFRYSNRSIFGVMETQPTIHMKNEENVTDVNQFNQALQTLLSRLRSKAAAGNSTRKFATGNESAGFETIFGLMQCTPDITEQDCNDCIVAATRDIPICCNGKLGGRVIKPSCNFRYENYRFYQPTSDDDATHPSLPVDPSVSPPAPKEGNNRRNIIIIVVLTVSIVSLIICVGIFIKVRKARKRIETAEEIMNVESLQFDFETIRICTDDFSEENKLGEGGFGSVYKGTLPMGQDIAVKRLSNGSKQGDLEFKNEVLLVAKLQHRNLVRLLGFCLQGIERLLIYEFVPNASLDQYIFDPVRCVQLDWEKRYKIIGGIARGLLYLHEDSRLRIIHRDLKASNILLDSDMNPKISDFGMARLFIMDQTHSNTSRIVGTFGYMAPEYAMHGQFSFKSDIFSFGVLILEIVSGIRNSCYYNEGTMEDLLSYAWKNWGEGTSSNLIDHNLRSGSTAEIMRCIHIGLLCVQENIAERPSVASIVLMLSSHSHTLPVPSQPAFYMYSSTEISMLPSINNSRVIKSVHTR
ncbi:cysteine-rich receptor-like protein kinase 29 [Ricinus communis]|uniref:cysteine-rich receptor-like protein kinase 29 n=1 Tax=Ricinus communis TaxID=3988 RepID=UPI0007722AB0|nr:cysteine-rich receptor-like protein kinase 29 [Ricinus communis]|eukprot:XP_015574234.1 cysteine-rich receptor-like protein kinase 29 [Ricinus communis]